VARAGRGEDAAALRDAFHLTRPGADPGPAGRRLLAWRALTAASPARCHAVRNRENEAVLRFRCRKWRDQNGLES
jgi:hypothetical protein